MLKQLIKESLTRKGTDLGTAWFNVLFAIVLFVLDWFLSSGSVTGVLFGIIFGISGVFLFCRGSFGLQKSSDANFPHKFTEQKSRLVALLWLGLAIFFIFRGVVNVINDKLSGSAVMFLLAAGAAAIAIIKFSEQQQE